MGQSLTTKIRDNITKLLDLAKIKKTYIIDDIYDIENEDNIILGKIRFLINNGKGNKIQTLFPSIKIDDPIDVVIEQISSHPIELNKKKSVLFFLGEKENISELETADKISEFGIPVEKLSPSEWENKKNEILSESDEQSRIMLLFDQDLSKAINFDTRLKGEDLIKDIKNKTEWKNTICSILTHTVTELELELSARNDIGSLDKSDFFVLSKKRLQHMELFLDGIKKAILNSYCEKLKNKTLEVIKAAHAKTVQQIEEFDTYSFDYVIFKSSIVEGAWEPNTLLRIHDIIFDDYANEEMIEKKYKEINSQIDTAQQISKLKFTNTNIEEPYKRAEALRSQELYEPMELINKLNKPIENGDIFKIVSNGEEKNYILVSQACDLMIRKNGKRNESRSMLFEIEDCTKYEQNEFSFYLQNFNTKTEKREYFANFKKSISIDIDVLDILVFNENGVCNLDIRPNTTKPKNLHNPWGVRYEIIFSKFKSIENKLKIIKRKYKRTSRPIQRELTKAVLPKFSFIKSIGSDLPYNKGVFKFDIERIKRLREPYSHNLLEKYSRYISRTPDKHDFSNID